MSSNITSPPTQIDSNNVVPSVVQGKAKAVNNAAPASDADDDDEEEDDDDEMGSGDEEDDEVEEDEFAEIDPTAIKPRRTRGIKVDYTSEEALKKAGLQDDDDDANDTDMHE